MAFGEGAARTEKPTPKRRREARQRGQVARSPDLVAWLSVLVASFLVEWIGGRVVDVVGQVWRGVEDVMARPEPAEALEELSATGRAVLAALAGPLVALAALAVVANLAQTGLLVSTKLLAPKVDRLNPLKGLKRLVSARSLWELGKQLVKLLVICAVAWPVVQGLAEALVGRTTSDVWAVLPLVGQAAVDLLRRGAAAGLVVAVADYAYERHRTAKQLRMTKQEVKEEMRSSEGNPEIKARLRSVQARMARNRMISAVARADVVVVNPTHVSVAISYRSGTGAPKVVAKGAELLAARIREEAQAHAVPVVEAPPLARALYGSCRVDDEIPAALYEAVARLLVFVHRLRVRTALVGHHVLPPAYQAAV